MDKQNESSEIKGEIKEYAEGWISERKGTDLPTFLKFAYIIIAGGCIAYLIIYMNGEINHADRGAIVQGFNAATQTADGLMYFVAAIGLIYVAVLLIFSFRKPHDE